MLGVRGTVGYEDRGSGEAVVLLHPFPLSRTAWNGLDDVLASRLRVIAVDARGFGESPLTGSYQIADLADDLAALLDERGLDRATVLGMSMGGYTALAFAARHRDRLAALILADTRAAADTPETRAARATAIETLRRDGANVYLDGSLPRLLSLGAPPAVLARARALAEPRVPRLVAGIEALRDRPDRASELASIRCPTLVLCGDHDQVTPPVEMRQVADVIPGAAFQTLPGAGHLSHLEAPSGFERAVVGFLQALFSKTRNPERVPNLPR